MASTVSLYWMAGIYNVHGSFNLEYRTYITSFRQAYEKVDSQSKYSFYLNGVAYTNIEKNSKILYNTEVLSACLQMPLL
jgi:hypothetical protein